MVMVKLEAELTQPVAIQAIRPGNFLSLLIFSLILDQIIKTANKRKGYKK